MPSDSVAASVLIPSWRRPDTLKSCLATLARLTRLPDQVIVVWQADDEATREAAEAMRSEVPFRLDVVHSPEAGVIVAENVALDRAIGDVVLLIDDDAFAAPDWLARHLAHYADPTVGAVGGPADNFRPDGTPFPRRAVEPIGALSAWGVPQGNMYDHVHEWRTRPPREVTHLVGYNMSLRRAAFDRFETGLRRYWQMFELDACLQARARGLRVMFDFGLVVDHRPTNTAYVGDREGDLTTKVLNSAYNHGFILGKHWRVWRWPPVVLRQLLRGRVGAPGVLASLVAVRRYGRPFRELGLLGGTARSFLTGLRDGRRNRKSKP
jgi:glycosyltransferase involved in cell wall biosynthesis